MVYHGLDGALLTKALDELGWCERIEVYNEICGDIYLKSNKNWNFNKIAYFFRDLGLNVSPPMFDY